MASFEDKSNHSVDEETVRSDSINAGDSASDRNVVCFRDGDPQDPHNWPAVRRWLTVVAVASMMMISVVATTMIVPAAPQVLQHFHVHDTVYRTLLVTMWDLGEGVNPFLSAPLSEKYGRAPIYHAGNLLGLVCTAAGALSTNMSMLVAFRFLGGFFLPAPTLAPAVIGDVIRLEERGLAMAVGMSLRILAPFVAPISGAYINQALGWRWTIWILSIVMAAFALLSLCIVRETYAAIILGRRAARLRKETGNPNLRSKHQDAVDANTFWSSISRPIRMLFQTPIVFLISLYTGTVCGIQYLVITTLTSIMEENYGFSEGSVGLTFIGPCTGFLIGMIFYALTSDRHIKYRQKKGTFKPEHRLVHIFIGCFALPAGLLIYGWTLRYRVFYIVPLIGTGITGFSMTLTMLPVDNYLVDVYEEAHSASAIAARAIVQFIFAATFPLAGPPLYERLGLGWGNSLLALIIALYIPLLLLLIKPQHWNGARSTK